MSGPNAPPMPDISIVSSTPVPFPKELTEQEMTSMSLEELDAYSAKVSTSIGWEYSTLQSYKTIQDAIDASIRLNESTIRGYTNEIAETDIIVSVAKKRKEELDADIQGLDAYILSRQSTVQGLDTEIQSVDATIVALTNESKQLSDDLAASDAAFVSSATYYSTLVYDYVGKAMTYEQQIISIQAESTLLAQALVEEEFSRQVFASTSASYETLSSEVQTLVGQSNLIQSTLIGYRAEESKANADLASTTIGIASLSSLYETSINTQRYYQAVSTQSALIETYTKALGLYNEASRMSDMFPTDKNYQNAKAIALQQLNKSATEKDQATQVVAELQQLVNVSQSASYEAILKSYQDTIDLEAGNVSTFGGRKKAAEEDVVRFSKIFDQAQADVAVYEQNIAAYTQLYNSSIEGAVELRKRARDDDIQIQGRQSAINEKRVRLQEYSTLYEQETSSVIGFNTIVEQKNKEYAQAVLDLQNFSTFYESTNTALNSLTAEETRLRGLITNNDAVLRVQSSIYERELVNSQAFQTVIQMSLAQQELAAMQYRETYARAKKMAIQEVYNAKLLQEVQSISTQNGNAKAALPAGAPFIPKAVDMNVPTLVTEFSKVNSINTFIASFNTVYDAYNTQITQLGALSTNIADQSTALETVLTIRNSLANTPTDTTLQTSLTTTTATLSAVQGRIQATKNNVLTATNSLNQVVQSFQTTYTSLFTASEIIAHTSTISSFLEAGAGTGVRTAA